MKQILFLAAAFFLCAQTIASSVPVNPKNPKASEVMIRIGKDGKEISVNELATISRKNLEELTGRKMTKFQSLAFKGAQKKLRNSIDENGNITNKKIQKYLMADGSSGFHIGGFALGFLLGLIGVLIAYLLNDDNSKNRRKWAWIGLGAAVLLSIIVVASFL